MLNNFLNNQMYALCILAALSLRQHVQHNWQINSAKRISSRPSFSFMKCIDPNKPLRAEKVRRDRKNIEEDIYQDIDESKSEDFLFSCFKRLTNGAQMIIDNIGVSINNSKVINNPWTKNIVDTMFLLSRNSREEFRA